jgi:hypothetical protein
MLVPSIAAYMFFSKERQKWSGDGDWVSRREGHVLKGPKETKEFCEIAWPCFETNDRWQKTFLILK